MDPLCSAELIVLIEDALAGARQRCHDATWHEEQLMRYPRRAAARRQAHIDAIGHAAYWSGRRRALEEVWDLIREQVDAPNGRHEITRRKAQPGTKRWSNGTVSRSPEKR